MSHANPAKSLVDQGLVVDVVRPIKTGKEASVLLCRTNPRTTGTDLAALKVFHPRDRRDFRDESVYRAGEWIGDARTARAIANRSRFGREAMGFVWIERELAALRTLHAAGAPVPRPIARTGDAILMEYVGDERTPAPQLRSVRPAGRFEAEDLLDQVLSVVRRMLHADLVHGDLSPYNVLVWGGRVTVIDLPQAVDPRHNPFAGELLRRDVARMCEWAARLGVDRPAAEIAEDLWTSWQLADLVPEELRGL